MTRKATMHATIFCKLDEIMDYRLTFSGRFHYRYGWGIEVHQHADDYQVQCIYGGEARVKIDNRIIHAEKGDVIFIPQGSTHEFSVDSKDGLKTLELKFQTDDPEILNLIKGISLCFKDEGGHLFSLLSSIVIEGYRKVFPYKILSKALLLECIALMARLSQQSSLSSLDSAGKYEIRKHSQNRIVQDVTDYVSMNINRRFSINEIAQNCGYSSDYLYRTIKKETGCTMIQFVNCIKFDQARKLIQHTELSLSEIAWNLGFSSLQYFSRFFHQHSGISPSEYMQKVRNLIRTDY